MASVKERISEEIKAAMRSQNRMRTQVLRMMLSEIKYAQVEGEAQKELSDDEAITVLSRYHKRLEKSLPDYQGTEKLNDIKAEMAIVEEYLPKKASEADVIAAITAVMAASPDRNFGSLMKAVMERLGKGADGKMVSALLKSKL